VKTSFAGRVFNDYELLEAISGLLNKIQPSESPFGLHHWIEPVKWVFDNNEDDYHE
jgi:hypothetical protein